MSFVPHLHALNKMILEGRLLEAFEKYCHEDVVMQENDDPPRIGKAENYAFEKNFVDSIVSWNDIQIKAVTTNEEEGVSMIVFYFDVSLLDGKRLVREQVTLQRWKEGKVVEERFYYQGE